MGKIGDLFVRLGLKSDGFKKGMKDAKKETQDFGAKLKGMKAGALAVWAAIGTAVIKFGQDFIGATNKMGDAWARNMEAIKAGYQTVMAEMSNYKPDFSSVRNFFKNEWKWIKETIFNAKEAGGAAKEMADAFDAEFELTQSVRLQRQAIQEELNELYAKMRDTSASNEARQAAQARYRALLQPIADAEIAVYQNMLNKAIEGWQAGTGLNRTADEIVEFFTYIGTNAEAMAAKFPDIYDIFQNKKGDKTNLPIFDIIAKYQQASNQMSNVDKEMARTTNAINANIKRELDSIAKTVQTYGQEELDLELDLDLNLELDEAEIEASMAEVDAALEAFANDWNAQCLEIKAMNEMLEDSLVSSFSSGMQALTDFMMGVENASAEQVLAAFIQPLADTMKQMGEMFMAEGLAMVAFKDSIKNPTALIAAGAALIAVSSIVSSGLQRLTSGTSGASTASAGSTGSEIETYMEEITVHVVGEISGDKIILAGQKTLNKWGR